MAVGTVGGGNHPAVALFASAAEAMCKAAEMLTPEQIWGVSNADLTTLLRAGAQVESVTTAANLAAVREAQVRAIGAEHGQSSTPAWLAQLLTLHPGEAKSRVQTADLLATKATDTAAALREGKLNASQARATAAALTRIARHASTEEFAAAEKFLLAKSRGLHAGHLTRLGRHIEAVLDPDGEPEREERAFKERRLIITNLGNGRHRLRGTLTDESAAIVKAALDPLAAPRPAADGQKDPRLPEQRYADALVDLCSRYLRLGEDLPQSRGSRPHVHLTVTAPTLRGDTGHPFARTATGEDLDPATFRKICCDAGITPIVINTLGEPLAVGREYRTVTPAIWAALVARDIGCVFPGCTRPASWTQAHHIVHWADGGETSLENCGLVCDFQHDQIHHHGWQIRLGPDGHPELIPPPWLDPGSTRSEPQRNAHWKLIRDGLHTDEPDRGP